MDEQGLLVFSRADVMPLLCSPCIARCGLLVVHRLDRMWDARKAVRNNGIVRLVPHRCAGLERLNRKRYKRA